MKTSKLFEPGIIGPITLRNRTIRAAAFEGMCPGNAPSEQLHQYHLSVAQGGIGMTTLAYSSVERSGLSFARQLWLKEENISSLGSITDDIHKAGAKASIQIGHCGNMSHRSICGCIPISASTGFNIYSPTIVRGMKEREIIDMAKSFGKAVSLARKAGFDAVEIHAGHGYLISQFLSPYTNKRRDLYGGSFSNRIRFMQMCMEETIKEAKDDIALLVKTNTRDGFKGGLEVEECIEIAKELEKSGAHALILSGGFVSKAPMYVMRGSMPFQTLTHYMDKKWLKYGIKIAGKWMIPSHEFQETYFFDDAVRFRPEIKIPLVYVGGIVSTQGIEKVLAAGFDFVAMARALVIEPDFVNRLYQEKQTESICCHANYCIGRMYTIDMQCHQHIKNLPPSIQKEMELCCRKHRK